MFGLLKRKRSVKVEESRKVEISGEDKGNQVSLVDDIAERRASVSTSVRSIIKAAISSAEQIVDSVKMQAMEEARQEAAKIIAEAKKEAEKLRGGAEVGEETAVETISAVENVTEEQMEKLPQAWEETVVQEEAETVQMPDETVGAMAETVSQGEDSAVAEPIPGEVEPEEATEEKEEAVKEEAEPTATSKESQETYTGEVELVVEVPIEPSTLAKLYNYLQTTSEVKFVRTIGSWNKGSTITISLDKPIPLISVLASKLPEANIVPRQPVHKGQVSGRGVRRINISLKKKNHPTMDIATTHPD